MPVEGPEQFELNTLESVLKSMDQPNLENTGKSCAISGIFGIVLLIVVYFLQSGNWFSSYWLYFMCVLSGVCLGGAAIINKLGNQSKLLLQYIDKEAIKKRIAELKM